MKKGLIFPVAALLAAGFALAGCDLLPFMAESGERFEADGLEQVLNAVAAKNYTVEIGGSNEVRYILENAIISVWSVGSGSAKRTFYCCYDTKWLKATADGNTFVQGVIKYVHEGGGGGYLYDSFHSESIQAFYDSFGKAEIATYDWEYDEGEKLYRHDGDTLRIDGSRVTVTLEKKYDESDPLYQMHPTGYSQTYVLKNFGATQYDLSYFDDARR